MQNRLLLYTYSRIHINRGEWFSLISQPIFMTFYKHQFLVMRWLP